MSFDSDRRALGSASPRDEARVPSRWTGRNAFVFQTGDWRVRHRKLRARLARYERWDEFEGTCRAWEILDGDGNVDDHWLDDPAGAYRAATIRRLENDDSWSIWWIDSRSTGIDAPVRGRFENGIGTFYGTDVHDGRHVDVRFIWSAITRQSARWEQAFSPDDKITWQTNWIMDFERVR